MAQELAFAAPRTEEMTKAVIGVGSAVVTGLAEGVVISMAPALGALVLLFVRRAAVARWVALAATVIDFLLVIPLMLAFDHGYIMGPTTGLERIDLTINPLTPYVDCLMCTRGGLRTCIPPETNKPVVLRCSTGATLLKDLSNEVIGVTLEDAVRINASAVTCQVCIGDEHEKETLDNL
ncbi:hypothetical protein LCGC14_2696180, partial [marine sediment metagenome]